MTECNYMRYEHRIITSSTQHDSRLHTTARDSHDCNTTAHDSRLARLQYDCTRLAQPQHDMSCWVQIFASRMHVQHDSGLHTTCTTAIRLHTTAIRLHTTRTTGNTTCRVGCKHLHSVMHVVDLRLCSLHDNHSAHDLVRRVLVCETKSFGLALILCVPVRINAIRNDLVRKALTRPSFCEHDDPAPMLCTHSGFQRAFKTTTALTISFEEFWPDP
jgi:hypothetical protein